MSQSFSYHIGKAFDLIPTWVRILVIGLAVAILYSTCTTTLPTEISTPNPTFAVAPAVTPALSSQENAEASRATKLQACQTSITQRRAAYDSLMQEKKYWNAALQLRQCAEILASPELSLLVKDAEVKSHLSKINDPKISLRDKAREIEMLARDYPDVGAQYLKDVPKLIATADRQEAAAMKRSKRSQGVSIGMSKEDVIASSWGRPQRINKTTNAYGTSEQWVYGNGGYLYFDNDSLVSIQN